MLLHEQAEGRGYETVIVHDAEDLIHPDELRTVAQYPADDFIQIPVLPLSADPSQWTNGIYCDEFALAHTRDLAVRSAFGGFVPSAGVGTAFSRRALDALASADSNMVFNPTCLTEDYDSGFRLHRLGLSQRFIPLRRCADGPLATRELFPHKWAAAVRQRERWVIGIVFQGWEKHGWTWAQAYWLWRDRKGPLVSLAGALSTVVCLYWFATRGFALRWLIAGAALQIVHVSVRAACVWRWFGAAMALTVPFRQIYADALNICAAMAAMHRYLRSKWTGEPLKWFKTAHVYPSREALTQPRTGLAISRNAFRAIPLAVTRKWNVIPFAIVDGELQAGSIQTPDPKAQSELRRFTSLDVRIHVMSPDDYAALEAALAESANAD
jgi:adsorption protein B